MSKESNVEDCICKHKEINGGNYYISVGKRFAQVTVPYENRDFQAKERMVAEGICAAITEALEALDDKEMKAEVKQ